MTRFRFGAAALLIAALGGCVSREEPIAVSEPAPMMRSRLVRTAPPPEPGELDLGLPARRDGGPAYVRSGLDSATSRGDLYGGGTLPQGF